MILCIEKISEKGFEGVSGMSGNEIKQPLKIVFTDASAGSGADSRKAAAQYHKPSEYTVPIDPGSPRPEGGKEGLPAEYLIPLEPEYLPSEGAKEQAHFYNKTLESIHSLKYPELSPDLRRLTDPNLFQERDGFLSAIPATASGEELSIPTPKSSPGNREPRITAREALANAGKGEGAIKNSLYGIDNDIFLVQLHDAEPKNISTDQAFQGLSVIEQFKKASPPGMFNGSPSFQSDIYLDARTLTTKDELAKSYFLKNYKPPGEQFTILESTRQSPFDPLEILQKSLSPESSPEKAKKPMELDMRREESFERFRKEAMGNLDHPLYRQDQSHPSHKWARLLGKEGRSLENMTADEKAKYDAELGEYGRKLDENMKTLKTIEADPENPSLRLKKPFAEMTAQEKTQFGRDATRYEVDKLENKLLDRVFSPIEDEFKGVSRSYGDFIAPGRLGLHLREEMIKQGVTGEFVDGSRNLLGVSHKSLGNYDPRNLWLDSDTGSDSVAESVTNMEKAYGNIEGLRWKYKSGEISTEQLAQKFAASVKDYGSSAEEAYGRVKEYQKSQESGKEFVNSLTASMTAAAVFSAAVGGVALAPATGGASLGLTVYGMTAAGLTGAGVKTGLAQLEAATGSEPRLLTGEELKHNTITGGIDGLLGGATTRLRMAAEGTKFMKPEVVTTAGNFFRHRLLDAGEGSLNAGLVTLTSEVALGHPVGEAASNAFRASLFGFVLNPMMGAGGAALKKGYRMLRTPEAMGEDLSKTARILSDNNGSPQSSSNGGSSTSSTPENAVERQGAAAPSSTGKEPKLEGEVERPIPEEARPGGSHQGPDETAYTLEDFGVKSSDKPRMEDIKTSIDLSRDMGKLDRYYDVLRKNPEYVNKALKNLLEKKGVSPGELLEGFEIARKTGHTKSYDEALTTRFTADSALRDELYQMAKSPDPNIRGKAKMIADMLEKDFRTIDIADNCYDHFYRPDYGGKQLMRTKQIDRGSLPPLTRFRATTFNLEHFDYARESEFIDRLSRQIEGGKEITREQSNKLLNLEKKYKNQQEKMPLHTRIRDLKTNFREKYDKIAERIKNSDMVLLQEIKSPRDMEKFLKDYNLEKHFVNRAHFPSDDGLTVLSTRSANMEGASSLHTGGGRPAGEVVLDMGGGKKLYVINVHLKMGDEGIASRAKEIAAIASEAKKLKDSGHMVLVGGDFNTSSLDDLRPLQEAGLLHPITRGPSQGHPKPARTPGFVTVENKSPFDHYFIGGFQLDSVSGSPLLGSPSDHAHIVLEGSIGD